MDYDALRALIERLGVHAELGPSGEGWGIEQNPHELATFLSALPSDIHTVLEIGTGYRAGLSRFMSECLGWQVTTVDRRSPDTPAPLVTQVIGLSQDRAVIEQVRGDYDLVIIDGDHAFESVKNDFQVYGSMGRILMFHDIAGLRECDGVSRFWGVLTSGQVSRGSMPPYCQVIASGDQRAGIGWIEMVTP